jgi:hypothetical protein
MAAAGCWTNGVIVERRLSGISNQLMPLFVTHPLQSDPRYDTALKR